MRLGLVECLRVRDMDTSVRCPVANGAQPLLLQFEEIQLEVRAPPLVELNVSGEAVQTNRIDKVVQGQAVIPRVLQLTRQVPRSQYVAGVGRHQTGSEHVDGIKDERWFRLEIAPI